MGGTSRSSPWEGHATLKAALDALATAKGVSANRVKAVASAAFQYAKDYKRVVHDVEIFLWKAEVEHRLAGLYAMDAIMRQSQAKLGAKDVFVKRFLLHLNNTIAAVKKIPADQQGSVRHVIEEWQTRGYYTPEEIEQAGGAEFSLKNAQSSSSAAAGTRVSPTHADPASKEKLASLLSIIKKQKELIEQGDHQSQPSILGQPPLLPTPSSQMRHHDSPRTTHPPRQTADDRQQGRSSGNYGRDEGTPSRDRGRDRSRSRDRGQGSRPSERSRERSRSRDRGRDSTSHGRDRRGASPQASPSRNRSRRDQEYSRRDSLDASRDAKKARGSRWGPPRPADSGGDDNRPPVIDTSGSRDHDRSSRFESRSPPRNRFDGPPGPGPMPGPGAWAPNGYQGPPPPFRSGPPPMNSYPPPGPQGGPMPPPRGGLDQRMPPPRERDAGFHQQGYGSAGNHSGGPSGPMGPGGFASGAQGPDRFPGNNPSQNMPPRSTSPPENAGEQVPGSSGQVCRKFLAGRCTFGDRCWHIHDQQATSQNQPGAVRPKPEMNQARRKTVLCANFPLGNCRYGDRCSFAHGEDDLDKSNMATRNQSGFTQDPMRGGPSPRGSSPDGMFQQRPPQAISPHHAQLNSGANAYNRPPPVGMQPLAQSRPPYGSSQPSVSNESMGERMGNGGPSGAYPGQEQPAAGANQWAGAAAASGYGGYVVSQPSQAYPSSVSTTTTPSSQGMMAAPPVAAPLSRGRAASRDEDEGEGAAAEFTLQYDEDE